MDEDWKENRLLALIDEGVFVEDPDSTLWLGVKMRSLVKALNEDEEMKKLINDKATDKKDASMGAWTLLYMQHVGMRSFRLGLPRSCSSDEIKEAVAVLMSWNAAAEETALDEWSMRLRLR